MPVHGNGNYPRMVPAPSTSYREPVESSNGIMTNRPALKGNARIAEYRVLKGLPRADVALERLRNIGAIVKPIMVRHGWQLPLLVEFSGFQKNGPELLGMNVNHGQKILLRLRTPLYGTHTGPNNFPTMSDSFLPEDDVVYTMLHELTHNVHGPHDDKFFKFLKELEEEWFEMRRSGGRLPGDGWHTPGYRVGMGQVRDLPPAEARRKAALMAEERRRKGLLGVGGGRLGGSGAGDGQLLTPQRQQELAAEAAERRRRHDKDSAAVGGGVCPSTQSAREEAVKWHEEEQLLHGIKVITIEDDSDDEEGTVQQKSPAAEASTSRSAGSSKSSTPKLEASSSSKTGAANGASRSHSPLDGTSSIKKEPAKDSSAIVIDSDTEDEGGDEDFTTVSVKRVKRQPAAPPVNKGKAPTKPAASPGAQAGPSSSSVLSPGPSLAARTALAAMKKTATTGANAGANTAGWRCGICRQWMGGEKASLWVCVKCGGLARK